MDAVTDVDSPKGSKEPANDAGQRRPVSRRGMLVRTIVGVAFEYYDFVVFATFVPFFSHQIFVQGDAAAATLSALAVFAVGFVARPLGALVLGWMADRAGRKVAMMTAMSMTAAMSLIIGFLPTYADIGVASALILTIARIIQGFGHGGEATSAYAFVAETAPRAKRGKYSSLYPMAQMSGILAATLLGAVLTSTLSQAAMSSWGWRVPFWIGAALGLFALILRRDLRESDAYVSSQAQTPRMSLGEYSRTVWQHRGSVFRVLALTSGMTVAYYTWAVNATSYAISSKGAPSSRALWAGVVAQVIYLAVLPLWGRFSDRFGRQRNYMISGLGLACVAIPLMALLGAETWRIILPVAIALAILGAATSAEAAFVAELVPTRVRATALALPMSGAVALFGGTAPYLNTWLSGLGKGWIFIAYAMVMALVTFVAAATSPKVSGREFSDDE